MSDSDHIVSTFQDGDVCIEFESTTVVASGMVVVTVTLPILKRVEKILTVHAILTDPATTTGAISNIKLTQGTLPGTCIVGFTLENMGAGTSLTTNIAAIGF